MEHLNSIIKDLKNIIKKYENINKDNELQDSFFNDIINEDEIDITFTPTVNNKYEVYFFYNPKCPACQRQSPIWDEIQKVLNNYKTQIINIYNINLQKTDENTNNLLNKYSISMIPTFVLSSNDGKTNNVISKKEGFTDYDSLIDFIKDGLKN